MKHINVVKKLKARVDAWEAMRADGMIGTKKKMSGKSCFTKPGSMKKR